MWTNVPITSYIGCFKHVIILCCIVGCKSPGYLLTIPTIRNCITHKITISRINILFSIAKKLNFKNNFIVCPVVFILYKAHKYIGIAWIQTMFGRLNHFLSVGGCLLVTARYRKWPTSTTEVNSCK